MGEYPRKVTLVKPTHYGRTICLGLALLVVGCGPPERVTVDGRTASEWTKELRRGRSTQAATRALITIGPEAVLPVAAALSDRNLSVRRNAAYILQMLGPTSEPALPQLATGLADRDELIRMRCATTLGRIGPRAVDAVPDLIKALEQEAVHESRAKMAIVRAIAQIGPGPGNVAMPLFESMENERGGATRDATARALNTVLMDESTTAGSRRIAPLHRFQPPN